MANGALGGKICGAGGGGHVIFLVEIDKRAGLIKKLNSMAGKVVPFSFNSKGAETWSQ
jgi:D-glycero-alpha-D-manno-heptose-7-phosphate kinase